MKVVVSSSVVPVVSRAGPTITDRVTGIVRNLHGAILSVKATAQICTSQLLPDA